MNQKTCKAIELDKILLKLSQKAVCPETRRAALGLQPFETVEDVRHALEETDAMMVRLLKNGSPRYSGCEGAKDAVLRAGKGGTLSMAELLLVARSLRNFRYLSEWYTQQEDSQNVGVLDNAFYALLQQPQLEKSIYESILSETEMADTASHRLYEIRTSIARTEASIREKLDNMIKNPATAKYLQNAVVSMRSGRFVVPVKVENRSEIGGVIHDVSSSGGTLFVEPTAVVEANAKILQLRNQEKEEIERILQAYTSQVAAMETPYLYSYSAMLELDMLVAKAGLALDMNANKPSVSADYSFSLLKARHPLIPKERVVPIDVELGKDYDTLVVTGPNTGGKTVTLKTAGLLNLMAQCGMLIPAHERSVVCVFGKILVDIGDEQSIEQSLSTFSGHMKNISEILDEADFTSLILMDELGAGTDPAEGAALAVAIIEQLRRTGARVMATTHYGEMKVFALETPGVQNASCEFDVESLRPTYRLSVGVPGKSNAFLISRKLGIPEAILDQAQYHLSQEDKRLDDVLAQLDDLKLQLKEGQDEIERLKYEAEHQVESGKKKRDELIRQGEIELEAARQKAREMAQTVQNNAYALMDEMKKLQKEENISAQQRAQRAREIAKRESEKLFSTSDVVHESAVQRTPLKEVHKGDTVLVGSLNQEGTVVSVNGHGVAEVMVGMMKMRVSVDGLFAPAQYKTPKKTEPRRYNDKRNGDKVQRDGKLEVNLLGMTVDEAILEADRFIDNATMSGLHMVYLIHGKGTGALRAGLHQHLRTHKSVKTYRLGAYGEGESGVTVVELK